MGVEDPLVMSDTEQGDIARETQQDSDLSDEDIADTQDKNCTGYSGYWMAQKSKGQGKGKSKTKEGQDVTEEKAAKRSKKPAVLFTAEEEKKLVDFLHNNEILYNKL